MADKEVIINGKTVVHGQGVKESLETNTSTTACFDEVVTQGSPTVSYTLDIDRLVFETREQYEALRAELNKMLNIPGMITTREVIRFKNDSPFVIVKNFTGAILDGKDYEMKPEEHSAQNLKFICNSCEEYTENL
jgi:hypothetical protein